MAPTPKTGLAAGLNKGHIVTKRDKKVKPSHSKGVSMQHIRRHYNSHVLWCSSRPAHIPTVTVVAAQWLDSIWKSLLQKLGKRTRLIREVVRDVAGLAPYERRVSELLKVGKDKRALKLCKKKVSNYQREVDYALMF
jgi:large subunit ribosomal protein L36e